jgi:hypothetical protein
MTVLSGEHRQYIEEPVIVVGRNTWVRCDG